MNLLACDIGNSFIKFGLYKNDELIHFFRTPAADLTLHFLDKYKVDAVSISSVVPSSTNLLKHLVETKLELQPFIVSHKSEFNLAIDYDTPETLGIDRICGAEGAFHLYSVRTRRKGIPANEALLAVDFGTATTVNVLRSPNIFTGGLIAPGLQLMIEMLNSNTAQLPVAEFSDYKELIGKSTKSAIASGIVNSTAGMIEQTIRYLETGGEIEKIHVYITGGNAHKIMKHLNLNYEYAEDLVLRGAKSIYEKNSGK